LLWIRVAAAACVSLLALIFFTFSGLNPKVKAILFYRILGVLGILVASITVVTPILHKLSSVRF
jgi:hypothetical protein